MTEESLYYCDKCGRRIEHLPDPETRDWHLCPECTLKLYQKIFGKQEGQEQ